MNLRKIVLNVLLLCSVVCYGQNESLDTFIYSTKTLNLNDLKDHIGNSDNVELQTIFSIQYDLLLKGRTSYNLNLKISTLAPEIKALVLMTKGDILSYKKNKSEFEIFSQYQNALDIAISSNKQSVICEVLKKILLLTSQNTLLHEKHKLYLEVYQNYLYDDFEKFNFELISLNYDFSQDLKLKLDTYKNQLKGLPGSSDYNILKARYYRMIGVQFDIKLKQYDSAAYYHKKSINAYHKSPLFYTRDESLSSSINLAIVYNQQKEYQKSNKILDSIIDIPVQNSKRHNKVIALHWMVDNHENLKNIDKALKYLKMRNTMKDSIDLIKNSENINYLYTEFDSEKKTIENNELRKNQVLGVIIFISTILVISIIAFLIYRNTKRKQRISEQDRLLQIQKTETILKEKELESINAMIAGQEKERLRLAGELHDNLGSTLATVRMQVENLERNLHKVDDPQGLLQKTNVLINEAYTKVRSISHERNSGVMAKDGLIPAIRKLARTISANNNIQVEVQEFGLENRIPNELEITIFRIIQELVTNVIKHAEATEASISLTKHEGELNIMVEDNGNGFKVGKLEEKDGMGLGTIERRIEHLEGTMYVDSAIGRGTNITIDIPL